jgi:hypothetical protein
LERLGLLAQHQAGVYVLTEAGRRYIANGKPAALSTDLADDLAGRGEP